MAIRHLYDTCPGVVSVVTINFKGPEDTITCLRALSSLDWPADRLELICVENASGDESAELIRSAVPGVTLIESPTNGGFTGGCNLGVAHARGEYIAFLNNDARPDPRWLAAAIEELERDPSVGCVASKVLDWEGERVDYVDGAMTWFGMGYKREVGRKDTGEYEEPKDVLFATGAAMVVRADLYRDVGGFDERFFMFYEDVDFGWRLNLLGHRVRYVPTSVAYHRHHASMKKLGSWRERYLLERNALLCLYKNLEDATLARTLAPAIALAVRRTIALGGADATALDLQRSPAGEDSDRVEVSKTTLTGPYAVDYLVEQLPSLDITRTALQSMRRHTDASLLPLFRQPLHPLGDDMRYLAGYESVVAAFDIAESFPSLRFARQTDSPALETSPNVALPASAAGDLLQDYRASAAQRAERLTELVVALDAARDKEVKVKLKLDRTTEQKAQLQTRLTQAQARIVRLQERVSRLEGRNAKSGLQAAPGLRPRARRLARRVRRRLGRRAAIMRGRGTPA
jgi:GT2 family glycosyltransferase